MVSPRELRKCEFDLQTGKFDGHSGEQEVRWMRNDEDFNRISPSTTVMSYFMPDKKRGSSGGD